jgi:putative addiction module component (TIGR02574 family)
LGNFVKAQTMGNQLEALEIEEAWAAEVERRIADVESGAVRVIPISETLAQLRAALK